MSPLQKQLIIMNSFLVIGTIVALVYFLKKDKLKRSGQAELVRKKKMHNKYVFFSTNLLLRKRFRRIVMQFSSMSCYTIEQVEEESVVLFQKAVLTAVAMPTVTLLLVNDVMLSILASFVGYVYYEITVDKRIDKLYRDIVVEVSNCIQSIRERYMECGSIPAAVLYSDKGKYLDNPITRIYEILTDVEGEELLYEFCRTSPVRMIKTLATTCYIVNDSGDEKKENGLTAFTEEMIALRQECDTEIRRLEKTRIAFKSLSAVALVGLIVTPLFDKFLISQIPGTALLVKGMYGMVEKSVVIGITILTYYVISVINRPSVVNQTDKIQWIDNLSKEKKIKTWLQNVIPKKYKTRMKLEVLIKDSISSKNMEYIYVSKIIFASVAFISTMIFLICFVITAKSALWNNYKSLGFIPSTPVTETMYRQIKELDYEYMTQKEKLSDEETYKLVKAKVRGLKEMDIMNQAQRLSTKWDKYYSLGFKWYFVVVSYVAAVVAWFGPEVSLRLRKKLVMFESTEDVLQLQTMMIVLSNTKMDVFKSLYWLEKQSTIHKAPLRFAYHEYTSDPELALDRLQDSVGLIDFKRLVSKLRTAMYNLSIQEAFSDMALDKQQSLVMREMAQDEILESKKQWAKLLASGPAAIALIFGFVGPIIVLGFTELMRTFGALGSM